MLNPLNPSSKSGSFTASTTSFYKVDALKGGTEAMRNAREVLLPKHPEEASENYEKRLSTSTLVNYYVKAIDSAVGRAFSKGLTLENVPAVMSPLLLDIDGTGNSVDQFAQESLWNCIHHGTSYIVADYPTIEVLPNTLAEASAISARPYLISVEAPQVRAAYTDNNGGQERLTHFRWSSFEVIQTDDYLQEKIVEVVKAYHQATPSEPVLLKTWKKLDGGWTEYEPVKILGVTEIPVVCAYGWRTGFFIGKPVLRDLADLNILHYQSMSEQQHILSVCRVPFLHLSGDGLTTVNANPDGSTTVEPFKLSIHSAAITPKDTKIEWVETSGNSIAAGAENLAYLERKMEEASLTISTSAPGNGTATAAAINAAEAHSILKALCLSFEQSLSKALFFMSQFAGVPAPTITAKFDLTVEVPTAEPNQSDVQNEPAEIQ